MEMHHSPRTVPESSPRSVMFVEKMDSDRTGLVPSSNWLIGLDSMDVYAHHGPSVLIQLGPTVTNNISDLWRPRPTHHHSYPSCPSGTTRHAGPDTLVVANTHHEVIQDSTSTAISPNEYHHGFHPTTVCKIPRG